MKFDFKRTLISLCGRLCYGNKPSQVGKLSSCLVDFPCSWKYSVYRVYHIEMVVTKWPLGIEESMILLNYGA